MNSSPVRYLYIRYIYVTRCAMNSSPVTYLSTDVYQPIVETIRYIFIRYKVRHELVILRHAECEHLEPSPSSRPPNPSDETLQTLQPPNRSDDEPFIDHVHQQLTRSTLAPETSVTSATSMRSTPTSAPQRIDSTLRSRSPHPPPPAAGAPMAGTTAISLSATPLRVMCGRWPWLVECAALPSTLEPGPDGSKGSPTLAPSRHSANQASVVTDKGAAVLEEDAPQEASSVSSGSLVSSVSSRASAVTGPAGNLERLSKCRVWDKALSKPNRKLLRLHEQDCARSPSPCYHNGTAFLCLRDALL